MKFVRIYFIIFGLSILTAFGVFIWAPEWRGYLLLEDRLIENLSAGSFLISFLIGVLLAFRYKTHRKVLIALAVVSLIGFLDEISYGARLYTVGIPIIYGVPIDSVHDLIQVAYKVFRNLVRHNLALVLMLSLIVIIIVNVLMMVYRSKVLVLFKKIFTDPPYILTSFFILILLFSSVIDLEIWDHQVLYMVEELLEMNAGLALLFCGLSLQERLSSHKLTSSPA